jgi:hypothetical protein
MTVEHHRYDDWQKSAVRRQSMKLIVCKRLINLRPYATYESAA